MHCRALSLLILTSILLAGSLASAQSLPPCSERAMDYDGDGYGIANGGSACLVTVESRAAPAIVDLDTGNTVVLERAFWTVDDLVNKPITCSRHQVIRGVPGVSPFYHNYTSGRSIRYDLYLTDAVPHPFIGEIRREIRDNTTGDVSVKIDLWQLGDGDIKGNIPLGTSFYIERYDHQSLRIWEHDKEDFFSICSAVNDRQSIFPDTRPPQNNVTDLYYVSCIDSAPAGDGWGWDGYGSCTFDNNGDFYQYRYVTPDYVGALPLNVEDTIDNTDATCIDTDGDGWGWNGFETCLPIEQQNANEGVCDYSSAALYDGWGWNAQLGQSCPPLNQQNLSSQSCVDEDGDGWGWTGSESCRIDAEEI